jgi:hypothetical protein
MPTPAQATRISNLLWKETSGVDHPANMPDGDGGVSEGWMVMKAVDVNALQEALDSADSVDEDLLLAYQDLYQTLELTDLSAAPTDVQTAAVKLGEWLLEQGAQIEADMPDEEEAPPGRPTPFSGLGKAIKKWLGLTESSEPSLVAQLASRSDEIAQRVTEQL